MTTSAFVIIIDEKNRILLQHRSSDAPTNPSKWQLWGGAIEEGESPEEAVVRELNEELSLDITPGLLEPLETYNQDKDNESVVYIVHLKKNTELQLGEGDGYGFFDKDALSSIDMENITKTSIASYLNRF